MGLVGPTVAPILVSESICMLISKVFFAKKFFFWRALIMRCGPGYDLIELWEPLYLAQRAQKPPSKVVFRVKCQYFHPELPIFPPSKDAELHLSYSYQVSAKSIHFCQSYGQKRVLGDFLDAFLTPEWVKSATIRCYFKLSKHRKILDIKPL